MKPLVNKCQHLTDIILFGSKLTHKAITYFCENAPPTLLTLKDPGGGWNPPIGQEIACHFSQDHAMVTKILDIIHKHPKYQLVKSFFYYLDRFSRNLAETDKTS